jgi:ribosomal protein S21
MDQRIVTHIFAVAAPRLNSSRTVMARKARRRSVQPGPKMASFDSVNSRYFNTRGMFLAGICSRQRRPGSAGAQKENAARRRFREMKRRRFYEKPSEKSTRERAEAIRRAHKLARKKAQREGLIPAPRGKRVPPGRATGRGPFPVEGGVPRQP